VYSDESPDTINVAASVASTGFAIDEIEMMRAFTSRRTVSVFFFEEKVRYDDDDIVVLGVHFLARACVHREDLCI